MRGRRGDGKIWNKLRYIAPQSFSSNQSVTEQATRRSPANLSPRPSLKIKKHFIYYNPCTSIQRYTSHRCVRHIMVLRKPDSRKKIQEIQ